MTTLENVKASFLRHVHVAAEAVENFAKNILLKTGVALGVAAVPTGLAAWAYMSHPGDFVTGALAATGAVIVGGSLWLGAKVASHVHYHDGEVEVSAPPQEREGSTIE